jgi:hypothetical protein
VDTFDLLKVIADVCERLGIRYVVVGSMATMTYGEPRFTNDIDVLIDLSPDLIDEFCSFFPDSDYYLSRGAVESAIRNRRQFKIIQTKESLKIDCILPASPFDRQELTRGVVRKLREDLRAVFAAPEDVILNKLEYYRLGEPDKHLRDITSILRVSRGQIDMSYIELMAVQLNVAAAWNLVLERLKTTQWLGRLAVPVLGRMLYTVADASRSS